MSEIRTLKDGQTQIAPRTKTKAVSDDEGTNLETLLDDKQDSLIAGQNITIVGRTISATGSGGAYTGSNGIDITNNVVSAKLNSNTMNLDSSGNITVKEMTAATASQGGKPGLTPASAASDQNKFLRADATWQEIDLSNYRTSSAQDAIDNTKVDKVQGKGLSENDFTTTLKNKLNGIEEGATKVEKTSDIQNDSGFITKDINNLTNYSTTSAMNTVINNHHDSTKYDASNPSGFITSSYHDATKEDADATILKQANVVNNTSSTSGVYPLSANMGKELQEQINNLKARGRYLSVWNSTTGMATTEPTVNPYTYKTGDFFIVGTTGTTNYKPNGATYDKTVPSTTVETGSVQVNDTYYYDGSVWALLHTDTPIVAFSTLAGSPYDNTNLSNALNSKQATITSSNKLSADLIQNGSTNKVVTQTEKDTWSAKQNAITSSNKLSSDLVDDTGHTNKFVTSTEKTSIETALQPNDNITELNNNAGFITNSVNNLTNYSTTTTMNTAINNYHDSTKQDVIDSSHKLSADLISNGSTNKVVTQTEKNTWNNKVGSLNDLGITATSTELNYVDGVTSNIQTQLNGKQAEITSDDELYAKSLSCMTTISSGSSISSEDIYCNNNLTASNISANSSITSAGDITSTNGVFNGGITYTTITPTEANTNGIKFVILTSEPETKYDGWFYIITEE